MKLIAHRGNICGKDITKENNPEYIEKAIEFGYDAEIDLWVTNDLFLGHDLPQYKIEELFLFENNSFLWVHCKNLQALKYSIERNLNCFFHDRDDFTLTSKNYIWTYPNIKEFCDKSVVVLPENGLLIPEYVYGICSDNVKSY